MFGRNSVVSCLGILLVAVTLTNALNYCPPEWKEHSYACHYFNPTPMTWDAAEAACHALVPGAHLSTPRDSNEYNYIQGMRSNIQEQAPWLGLRYSSSASAYVDAAGGQLPSTPWYGGSPSTSADGYCAYIRPIYWDWEVANCSELRTSICMFYTTIPELTVESFVTMNRLHGTTDFLGSRHKWLSFQDGKPHNASLTAGPTGSPDSAIELDASLSSYIDFSAGTQGSNFVDRDFYYMFYLYQTASSVGPIIQYRFNQSHYGFNIWSYANGSMLIDFVTGTSIGPMSHPDRQVFVPSTCGALNQWNFWTINYWRSNNGLVTVRVGSNPTACVTVNIGSLSLEMSRGFDVGRRQLPMPPPPQPPQWPSLSNDIPTVTYNGDSYLSAKIACLVSGENNPSPFYSGQAMLWCQQALQETTMDRTMAKRSGIAFPREASMTGFWPLNDFYRSRDAAGRIFYGNVHKAIYGFGPSAEVGGSMVFDGTASFVSLSDAPNQARLAASMTFLRRDITISAWVHTTDGGPVAAFQSVAAPVMGNYRTMTVSILPGGTDVKVVVPPVGGFGTLLADFTFAGCLTAGTWQHLAVTFDYDPTGDISVFVNGVQCGASQSIGSLVDIEAHTNIFVGRSAHKDQLSADFYKGKMACFAVHSIELDTTEITAVKDICSSVLASGIARDKLLFKRQHLRFFLPLGRQYEKRDVSGRNIHGTTNGRLHLGTGPLGHPYSSHFFNHENRQYIDLATNVRENPYSVGSNDSVTYMGYMYTWPDKHGNLPYNYQNLMQHYDHSNGGRGFYFGMNKMTEMHMVPMHKGRWIMSKYSKINSKFNPMEWNWFVVQYSRLTRNVTITVNGQQIADYTYGWYLINTFSALRIGSLSSDDYRWTGKLSCLMMYDTDIRPDESDEAREMCHRHLIRAYGPVVDTTKCYHSSQGWEYKGNVSWTVNNRICKPWLLTSYVDPLLFPDSSVAEAGSFCRNPEMATSGASARSKPWCFTEDPAVPWEYCNVNTCEQQNVPFYEPENLIGYWPMGNIFRGSEISGHEANARIGSAVSFTTGPFSISNGATFFSSSSDAKYWVRHAGHQGNMYHLYDLGKKNPWIAGGWSYTLFAQYRSSLTGNGALWSWESSEGNGGKQALLLHFDSNSFKVKTWNRDRKYARTIQCPYDLVANQWYQLTFVYNLGTNQFELYTDTTKCATMAIPSQYINRGLYANSGSFKFGNNYWNNGPNVPIACGQIYMKPLKSSDIAVIGSKCRDILSGNYNDFILGGKKPLALWPMSSITEGSNSRGPNHAFYSMASPVANKFGLQGGALHFPGNNMQYFWASQDYSHNLDVCASHRSFTMSTYAYVEASGTAFAFHMQMSGIDDNINAISRGNQLAFLNTENDIYFKVDNSYNPIKTNAITTNTWVHVTVSYDYLGDNFRIFHNGQEIYHETNKRSKTCRTSGSVSLARAAFRPLTLSYDSLPMTGALSCAQIYEGGMSTEKEVQLSQRYCSHPDYIGCFPSHKAGSTDFVYNAGYWDSTALTVTKCREVCGAGNYKYAGLRGGDICMCGNSYGSDGPEEPESCSTVCTGSANDWCGGDKHYSVYHSDATRKVASPAIKSADYLSCLPGWHLRGTECYRVFGTRLDMLNAIDSCESHASQLASVTEDSENTFIAAIAPSSLQASDYICLGMNETLNGQARAENMDSAPFFYANWASGQPSYKDYWVCMLFSNKQWYAQNPLNQLYYACKKKAAPYTDSYTGTACRAGWSRFGDSCYLFQKSQIPYRSAQTNCSNYQPTASLAKITSYSQFKFIQNITDWQRPFWIGLEYSQASTDFVWAKDSAVLGNGFSSWAGDESYDKTTRPCVFADSRSLYGWRTADCEGEMRQSYVCQYDLPATNPLIGLASGRIINKQIKAVNTTTGSESYYARVGGDKAWCTTAGGSLSIDLVDAYSLEEMWMQGNPEASEWTTEATLEYSTDAGTTWTTYTYTTSVSHFNGTSWAAKTTSGTNILPINADQNTICKIAFATNIANVTNIRITPTSYNSNPCLRLEFKGHLSSGSNARNVKMPFVPLNFELERLSGAGVTYTVTSYFDDPHKPTRMHPTGISETVLGYHYAFRPRHVGHQKVVFGGIDAEGKKHELSYEFTTSTPLRSIALNMCPLAVLFGSYAPCEARVIGGSSVSVTTDYGFEIQGPRQVKSRRFEVGSTTPPSVTTNFDSNSYVYLMPNQVVRNNATVYAIELEVKTPGWFTIQIYQPSCESQNNTYFCPVCHCCLPLNTTCSTQHAFDSYRCSSAVKDPWANCSQTNTDVFSKTAFFTSINPAIDYKFVTEWRKYVSASGLQIVYLNDNETMEVTLGMVMGYYRDPNEDGVMQVYSSSTIKEFFFLDSASGYSTRVQSGFTVTKNSATATTIMHMVKLITMSSVGISFGRKWNSVDAGTQNIIITAQDDNYPENVLTLAYNLEVQHPCIDFKLDYADIGNATQQIPFLLPEHNGTKCHYSIDWGDRTSLTYLDYSSRNDTIYHLWKLDGTYTITLTAWNLVFSSTIQSTITIVFPIQKMSIYLANPPAVEYRHYTTTVLTYAQASSAYSIIDLDVNNTESVGSIQRNFSACPSGWVSGINELKADSCYRYFYTDKMTYDHAQSYCASLGATLATAKSSVELNFLKQVMTTAGGPTDTGAWLGYNQLRDGFSFWVSEQDKSALPSPFWQETSGAFPIPNSPCGYYDYASRRVQNAACNEIKPMICKRQTAISTFCGPTPGWTYDPASNRCFRVFTALSDYLTAVEGCRQIGGQLAVPDSAATFSIIHQLVTEANPILSYYMAMWRPSGNDWKLYDGWQDVTPLYTNFDTNQPTLNQGENCVVLKGASGKWKSVTCSDIDGYVCEKPIYGQGGTNYFSRTPSRRYIVPQPQPPTCPIGWTMSPTTATCYKLVTSQLLNWADAENYCLTTYSAHLATLQTTADQDIFWNQVVGTTSANVWIGYAQLATNSWIWSDGSVTTGISERWDNGQPTLVGTGNAYYPANTNYWRSGAGSELFAFACSKPAVTDWKTWAGSCPVNYIEFSGRCFRYVASATTFTTASTNCKTEGAGLATIQSAEDLDFMRGMLPVAQQSAWVGATYASTWGWADDVRGARSAAVYSDMWATAPPDPPGATSCGYLTRTGDYKVAATSCTNSYAYICEQPAAVCPPGWKIWAGSCYRSFDTPLHIQPGTVYDTARAACQYEDSLPISPLNTDEFNMAKGMAGSGRSFGFGYRRLAISRGFVDMWGRPSYFAGTDPSEPTSGNYYAYYTGSAIAFTSDVWTDVSICQSPSKISADSCIRECLATSEFRCQTVYYTGSSCQFSAAEPSDDWFGLREVQGAGDLYLMRKDLCPVNLLADAMTLSSSESTPVSLNDVLLADGNSGFMAANENDTLTVELANTIWVDAIAMGKPANASNFVETFKLAFTFDREEWVTYQYPISTDYVFTANDVDAEAIMVKLPKPVLLKAFKIVPVTFTGMPSYKLRVIGCDGALFTDYAEFKYMKSGTYVVGANTYSPPNNMTVDDINVPIQSKLTSATIPVIPPLPFGNDISVPFTYVETAQFGFATCNATFDGTVLSTTAVAHLQQRGTVDVGANMYSGIGFFPINITVDNLLSDPIQIDTMVAVDYAVANLSVATNASADNGALYNQTVEVYVTMANCSRCNVSISSGAADSVPLTYSAYFDYIMEYTPILFPGVGIPTFEYPTVSILPYTIKVTANNFLPYKMTAEYQIYIQRLPVATSFSYTASQINKITVSGPAVVDFSFLYSGYVFRWPTSPSMFLDFQDGSNLTKPFGTFMLPPPTATDPEPIVSDYLMGFVQHPYSVAGLYSVPLSVYNRVGTINGNVTFNVDEDIVNLRLVPRNRYITPGDVVFFDIAKDLGSRFHWQVQVPNPDNTTDWSEVYYSTETFMNWTFTLPGYYFPSINASSLVQPNYASVPLELCCPIVVQHPVLPNKYRLTASPTQGKLVFENVNDDVGHAITKYQLWVNPAIQDPTNPFMIVDYGDNKEAMNMSLICDPALAATVDGPWVLCKELPYTYKEAIPFTGKVNIFNLVSSETFSAVFTIYVSVVNLKLSVRYSENETHHVWEQGFPRIDPVLGPKPYSLKFFPSGKPLRIVASAKLGEGLRYCFSSSIEGVLTDCSNVPVTQSTPNSIIRTFDYDTPCGGRLERCGLTLFVVASNPVDTATASINVFLQKPPKQLKLVEYGPAVENTTFPLWLTYEQLGTDLCVEMDTGSDFMNDGPRKRLFNSEYMCADTYSQEEMKSLVPFDSKQIATKALALPASYYKHGLYTVKLKGRNFVGNVDYMSQPKEMSKPIIVTRGPCSKPLLYIDTNMNQLFKKNKFRLPAFVKMNCSASNRMSINHTILYKAEGDTTWSDVSLNFFKRKQLNLIVIGSEDNPVKQDINLKIKEKKMPYGMYRFVVDAMMVEEIGINNTIHYEVEVIESPLIVGMTPSGSRRDLVYGDQICMNAYELSFDPDEEIEAKRQDGIEAYYFGKRDCDGDFPVFSTTQHVDDFINDPSGYRAKYGFSWRQDICVSDGDKFLQALNYDSNGIFMKNYHAHHPGDPTNFDFPSLNQETMTRHLQQVDCGENATAAGCDITLATVDSAGTLCIDSRYQYENMTYNIMAVVRKGKRYNIVRQSYRLERGRAPQALVKSVTNAVYPYNEFLMYNPTSRGSFRGLVTDRVPGVPYFFEWRLILLPDHITPAFAMENIDIMATNYSWPREEWVNDTSTGWENDDLSINKNFLSSSEYNYKYLMAYVEVLRGNNPRRGVSSLLVIINKPPNAENVTCLANKYSGYAMETEFTFDCQGFTSDHGELSKFVFSMKACSYCPQVVLTETIGLPSLSSGVALPAGVADEDFVVTIYIDATDEYGSMVRVKFPIVVMPRVDLAIVKEKAKKYAGSVDLMIPQDLCQHMFTFGSLMNAFTLDPIYAPNETAYALMTEKEQKTEMELIGKDRKRYYRELYELMDVRENITNWIHHKLSSEGLRDDSNRYKTCCSAITAILESPEQSQSRTTLKNSLDSLDILQAGLKILSQSPDRDADRFDDASSTCSGVVGKISSALNKNLHTVRNGAGKEKKNREKRSADTEEIPLTDKEIEEFEKRFGSLENSKVLAELQDVLQEDIYSIVMSGKVLRESSSVLEAPGMKANVKRSFVRDMNNTIIPTGGPGDCGSFRLGDALKVFMNADPEAGNGDDDDAGVSSGARFSSTERLMNIDIQLKSSMAEGNSKAFDNSSDSLNSQVQGLVFTNSTGHEIVVKNLPFEIDITVESNNPMTPDQTELKSLTTASPRGMKSMVMNISEYSALFINVERWNLPNMCNNDHIMPNDIALNASCTGNVTTIIYERVNHTVPSLNITDEDVIFFVFAKYNQTPTEFNFDLSCSLPRMAFENEVAATKGLPVIDYYTGKEEMTSTATGTTISPATTAVPTTTPPSAIPSGPVPECASLDVWNVTCCNGTVDPINGNCFGQFVLPTTPAPTTLSSSGGKTPKNCSRPAKPDINMCFFDHRLVNVTGPAKLFKIGVRAVPRSLVRAYLEDLYNNGSRTVNLTMAQLLNKTVQNLANNSVRVGYRYQAFTASCKFYDVATKKWSSEGCRVGDLSTPGGNPSLTQCFCNHLTSFSSGFDVPMNTFDPNDSAFNKLDENPICFAFGICVFCLFFTALIWARKKDKEDERKWGTTPLADNDPRDKYAYELTVWTGHRSGAGTTARVSFMLRGDEGETPVHMLEDDEREVLQRGGIDSFLLLTPRSLGKLVQLRIWHDNSGRDPNWYMGRMQVHDMQRNRQYYFLVDRWLAIDEDDGMVERIVPVAGKKELAGFEHLFFTKSRRKLTDGHIWVSVFSRPPLSKFTRCQRLTCCLSVLYCTMLANIMFYGQDSEPPGTTSVALGPISMSLTKIFMSVVSALVVVPVNLIIVQLFRMSKHRPTKKEKKMEDLRARAVRAETEERKRILAAGAAAPPEQVGVTTVSEDVAPETKPERPMSKRAKRKAEKAKKKKKTPFRLPWWCIIVAYILATCTCGVCFWAIVEYGGALGPEKAEQWLVSMMISLVTDILFMQPLKILAIAMFYALIIRNPTSDEDLEEKAALKDDEMFLHERPSDKEMAERRKNNEDSKRDYVFLPPDPEELKQARELRMKEKQMWKIIKEIAFYVFFLYLLMMVAFATQDDWSMQLQKQMRSVYLKGSLATKAYNVSIPSTVAEYKPFLDDHQEDLFNIRHEDQFYDYLDRTLIPSILDGTWYNGAYESTTDIFTKDQTSYLVGSLRIRQVRTGSDACRIPKGMRYIYTEDCLAPYSIFDEETRNFTAGWEVAPVSNSTTDEDGKYITEGDSRGFAYTSEIDDRGLPFTGNLETYNGGGYIVDLGKNVPEALAKSAFLRQNRWVDSQTRAVFIEFNLYCANRNLFAISQTLVEFFAGGSVVHFPYFYITKLDPYFGTFALVLLGFEIFTFAIVIFLFVRECKLAIKYKKAYWADAWAVLEFVHLLSCIIMAIMFLMRYAMTRFVLGDNFRNSKSEGYTNFTLFITYDQLVSVFMGFVLFVAFLRMVRLLRFNRRLVLAISTLKHVKPTMVSFFVVFFVVYVGFAQMGYIAFGARAKSYSTFVTSLESLFSMLLGTFDFQEMRDASTAVGPFFFLFFSLFVNIFLINAFIALLIVAYEEVRADASKQGNEHEMMSFIMNKFKAMIGLAPSRPTTLSIDKRFAYLDAAIHEDEVDKFTNRMDDLMTKLDEHLEKTKSQFGGMFDQKFLQRKQREVYTTD